jgi:hypothetical protein
MPKALSFGEGMSKIRLVGVSDATVMSSRGIAVGSTWKAENTNANTFVLRLGDMPLHHLAVD